MIEFWQTHFLTKAKESSLFCYLFIAGEGKKWWFHAFLKDIRAKCKQACLGVSYLDHPHAKYALSLLRCKQLTFIASSGFVPISRDIHIAIGLSSLRFYSIFQLLQICFMHVFILDIWYFYLVDSVWWITRLKRIPLANLGFIQLKECMCVNKDCKLTGPTRGIIP